MKHLCGNCGNDLGTATVALSWPSHVKCRRCGSVHGYRHAWLIGTCYLALPVVVVLAFQVVSHQFANEDGGEFTASGLQQVIALLGPMASLFVIAPLYAWWLGRSATLRLKSLGHSR